MAERDLVVQLAPSEADLILKCLRIVREELDSLNDILPLAGAAAAEKGMQLTKVKTLMYRVRDATPINEFTPAQAGGVAVVNATTNKIEIWSLPLADITGYSAREALGKRPTELLAIPQSTVERMAKTYAAEEEVQGLVPIRTKTGRTVTLMSHIVPLQSDCELGHPTSHFVCHYWLV